MGFREIAPADMLGALYNPRTHMLTLSAKGKTQKFGRSYEFVRDPWLGGLKFTLWYWSGPIGQGTEDYTHSQSFYMPAINTVDPSGTVQIVHTGKGPHSIPIHWLGFGEDESKVDPFAAGAATSGGNVPASTSAVGSGTGGAGDAAPLTVFETKNMTVLYKEPFSILHPLQNVTSSNMTFEKGFLTLDGAGYLRGAIQWTFDSLKTGETMVSVQDNSQGLTPVITRYIIEVIVLDDAK